MGLFGFGRKKEQEPVLTFEAEDPEMLAAIHKAQSTYSEFLAEIDKEQHRIVCGFDESLVKYAFPADRASAGIEHMFISDLELIGSKLYGLLASSPNKTKKIKAGDRVEIDPARVSDWLYVIEGKGHGGFTFKVMWSRFSDEEKALYQDEPPFVWVNAT